MSSFFAAQDGENNYVNYAMNETASGPVWRSLDDYSTDVIAKVLEFIDRSVTEGSPFLS
jgi:hypothetical protein